MLVTTLTRVLICSTMLLSMAAPSTADPTSLDTEITSLVDRSGRLVAGSNDEHGDYIIVSVKIRSTWGDDAMPQAKQTARDDVAKFFGVQVSGSTESTRESESAKVNGKKTSKFKKSFKKTSRSEVDQFLRGLGLDRVVVHDGNQYAIFVLSENGLKQSASLAEAVRSIGHETGEGGVTTVKAIGMAAIRNDDVVDARKRAISQAHREALEKVMGMVVVGITQSQRKSGDHEQFRESVFSNTDGFIDEWEAVDGSDGQIGENYRIVIMAVVTPHKLYDNYRTHLQSMGDPTFSVHGGEKDVRDRLSSFFRDKGFRIVDRDADWTIETESEFLTTEDPRNPARKVKQLEMQFQLRNTATGEIIGPIEGPRRFSSRSPNEATARRNLLDTGFAKWKDILHKKINDEIVRMAREGRKVIVTVAGWQQDMDTTSRLAQLVQTLPGVKSINQRLSNETLTLELAYVGDAGFLQQMIQESMRSTLPFDLMDGLTTPRLGNDAIAFALVATAQQEKNP